jgi:hypothetical protein
MKMPTMNDKITTSNDKVSKKHNGNIRCVRLDMQFFWIKEDTKMLKVGALKVLDMMLKDTEDKSA